MIRVCSGFSPAGYKQYGKRFLDSFDRFWPRDVDLQVYVEEPVPMPRKACRDLWSIPGARQFHVEHAGKPTIAGTGQVPGWKEKDRARGYCFRFDAYKFWKQILIPGAAAQDMADGDILIWLDADVETTALISQLDIVDILGKAEVAFLDRSPKHSEIGFYAIRLNNKTRAFLEDMATIYTSGEVFELAEWHSAFVWDTARKRAGLKEKSICRLGARGNVWPATRLAKWLRHDKGNRKPKI